MMPVRVAIVLARLAAVLPIAERPRIRHRVLNHWDHPDGTVERGHAGGSRWDGHTLPACTAPRYTDSARANASLGIDGTVLTKVNDRAPLRAEPAVRGQLPPSSDHECH